jgi:phospholipase C
MARLRSISSLLISVFAIAACSGGGSPLAPSPGPANGAVTERPKTPAIILHVVLMIQENRSFDNLFATFPGADGATSGKMHNGQVVPLKKHTLASLDITHTYPTYLQDYDGGNMDGFDLARLNDGKQAKTYPYQYVDPNQIQPYWILANEYALADHMFQTQGSGSFTAHQDLIAGATVIDPNDSIVDDPSSSRSWGCDAQKGTVTSLITTDLKYLLNQGPFPCLTYPTGTLRDLLDKRGVSWKYYTPPHLGNSSGALWNAFDAIPAVRYGPEWKANVSVPETNIFGDITNGQLPGLSWVIPDHVDSDHPRFLHTHYDGPAWIASVVNAIGTSKYWDSTTIIVVWDDWGGFYDHEPPAFIDNAGGLGFRVPMLVISPYVRPGVVHTQYEFGSILKYIEETFDLGSLGTTDVRATSIGGILNPEKPPRSFRMIPAARSRSYFLRRPPSYEPVDTE